MSMRLPLFADDTVAAPPGLEYHEEFLTASEELDLLGCADASGWLSDISRRVQHFGFKYDYSDRWLDETARIGSLPGWLAELACKAYGSVSEDVQRLLDPKQPFEQAIINEYLPGQGIAPHVDRDCFGPVVATVSLGAAINMDFRCDATGEEHGERLARRSLLVLRGEARTDWRHSIAKRKSDLWNGQQFKRERRVSITFRTIADLNSGSV
ncbi:alpha-ketoglutarate-dependent dioxygenase AlkB [Candidatus Poriferisodalis sp.]|uniref:alpha-ketoglutarate-dependent dioxygenase AlkB n=1 Tax=Candidatus Poriferisodalis sp. TaxID=3101277 RepID=UPI003B01F39A